MSDLKRIRAIVTGRVQGVGFRAFAVRRAGQAGVTGWVANRSDGSVECVAEGEDRALQRFLDEIRRGPRFGRVASVAITEEEPEGLAGFNMRSSA